MFSQDEKARLQELKEELAKHMQNNEKRYVHSLGVADAAVRLAEVYDLSRFDTAVAGLLHDWEKNKSVEDIVTEVEMIPGNLGFQRDDLASLGPTLHGYLAAHTLPKRYPWLSQEILKAIALHTTGAYDISELGMALFVADAIELGRGHHEDLEALRDLVGGVPLDVLYKKTFIQKMQWVTASGKAVSQDARKLNERYLSELAG